MNPATDAVQAPGTDLQVLVLTTPAEADRLVAAVAAGVEDVAEVVHVPLGAPLPDRRTTALIVLAAEADVEVDAVVARCDQAPTLADASLLVVTSRDLHDDLATTLDRDRLAGLVTLDGPPGALTAQARSHLARWLRARAPDDPRLALLDVAGRPRELPDSELLRDLELDDVAIAGRVVAALERALGPRPRIVVPEGTRLTREGHSVDAVLVLIRGSVALERPTRAGALRLHHGSTGPVIGLLSLAQQRRAFFTSITTTEAELVHVSLEQLDLALHAEPEVGAVLAAIAIKGLARRLRRSEQLQIERTELNRDLEHEREELRRTLQELERTRDELVRQARLATLGELAAGVAHELNNPVAALTRASSYVALDAAHLLSETTTGPLGDLVAGAHDRAPLTTAQERDLRRALTEVTGDPETARLLVTAGVTDIEVARRIVRELPDREQVAAAIGLGSALRNLDVAASRIAELVTSLRTYARPGVERLPGVDLGAVVDDALRLVGHRLDGITVHRESATTPPVVAHPAELGQVVTNLLTNAAEAMEGRGTVTVRTRTDGDEVVLEVIDDGPGIPEAELARLDEPRFTTKQGTVRFGLGLGLSIVRRIVEAHGGRFDLRSRPGRTVAEVRLPSDEAT